MVIFPALVFLPHPMLSLTQALPSLVQVTELFSPLLKRVLNLILFPRQTSILLTFIYFVDMYVSMFV